MEDDWSFYRCDYDFAKFAPGMRVLDIGCGKGRRLKAIVERGCEAIGIEPRQEYRNHCATLGLSVLEGYAEQLPFPDATFDGVVCKVVIAFTAEPLAFHEMARVIKPGGTAEMCYQGAGYFLRYLVLGQGGALKHRFFGLKALINTWLFAVTGKVLPGFLGDTVYQSRHRLRKYYKQNGFTLIRETPSPTFLGLPVFIYHHIRAKVPLDSVRRSEPPLVAVA